MSNLILASKSKVRKEILNKYNINCIVEPSNVDEDSVKKSLLNEGATPEIISKNLAELKANKVSEKKNGEIVLINSHIASYKQASYSNHNPIGERKLLLNKREINKLIGKMQRDGFTIVPTKMYFKKGKAKIEIAVAKGKKQYDKRHTKKTRDWNREKARYFRRSS